MPHRTRSAASSPARCVWKSSADPKSLRSPAQRARPMSAHPGSLQSPVQRACPMSTPEVAASPLLGRVGGPQITDEDLARSRDRSRVHHARRHSKRWRLLWLLVGPGILAMLGENDGPSMIAYAADGAQYGLGFFVPFIPLLFVMAFICQEMCMRVGAEPAPHAAVALQHELAVAAVGDGADAHAHLLADERHHEQERDEWHEEPEPVLRAIGGVGDHARPVVLPEHREDPGADEQPQKPPALAVPASVMNARAVARAREVLVGDLRPTHPAEKWGGRYFRRAHRASPLYRGLQAAGMSAHRASPLRW